MTVTGHRFKYQRGSDPITIGEAMVWIPHPRAGLPVMAKLCFPTHRHVMGRTCVLSTGRGPGTFMSEDPTAMEGEMKMSERWSLRCWRVQGLSYGGCSLLASGPALGYLWPLLGWPGYSMVPQLGC